MPITAPAVLARSFRPASGGAVATTVGICLACLLAGCGKEKAPPDDVGVVVRIGGGDVIRVADIEEEIQRRAGRANRIPEMSVLLDEMIDRRILVGKARAEKLDRDPGLKRSWENLLISRYKEEHLREKLLNIKISEEEVKARYQADAERYRHPAKARLAILHLPFDSVMTEEERQTVVARMAEGRERAVASPAKRGFGTLAVNYSEDQVTRYRGGDTGWLDEGVDYRWPVEVVRAGFGLETGAISEPLPTADGVYLVMKLDERPGSQVPLEQVQDQIRKTLVTNEIHAVEEAFALGLRENISIETYSRNLAGIHPPAKAPVKPVDEEEPPELP